VIGNDFLETLELLILFLEPYLPSNLRRGGYLPTYRQPWICIAEALIRALNLLGSGLNGIDETRLNGIISQFMKFQAADYFESTVGMDDVTFHVYSYHYDTRGDL
jgi:hypothetical protein